MHKQAGAELCQAQFQLGYSYTVNCFDGLHQDSGIHFLNIMVTLVQYTLSIMVKFIVTIIVIYNTDIDNSIPNVCALIMVIYQNHHYVCRLDISHLILNKSSGRE